MKKTLLIAALTLMSASAFASKARVNSLQSGKTVSDFSDVLSKPDKAMNYGDTLAIEFGAAQAGTATVGASTTQPTPEGGFVRKMDGSALGFYLGNTNFTNNTFRTAYNTAAATAAGNSFLLTENTLNLIYAMDMGDMTVGGGLAYSKSSRKPDTAASAKSQDLAGIYLSASGKGTWDAQLAFGLMGSAKSGDGATEHKMQGKGTFSLSGGMNMDTMYVYGHYAQTGAKYEIGTTEAADNSATDIKIGVENQMKKDGTHFFYGAALQNTVAKNATGAGSKTEAMFIPLNVGIEADATTWLTLRGSITQNLNLMDSYKETTGTAISDKRDSSANTTVAAGAGLKFGKMTVDGLLAAGTSGALNTASFMTNASMTYTF